MTHFSRLGKYHVLERLAASRLAEIYKVKTVGIAGFEKVQILSRILPRYANDPLFVKAFIAEAKLAFSLNHRNIVQVFEFGKVDGELLATEYIPGVNLKEILHEAHGLGRSLPIGLVCYLMSEVAAGLDYAHRKSDQLGTPLSLVHGELAPYHVACSWEGSVKVLDFGLARAASAAAKVDDRYRGLPRYLSPEQVHQQPVGPRSDIFSFGAVLWELLAGQPLMAGSDDASVRQAVLTQPITSPRDHNREVPPELETLTLACLHRDPDKRVASASDLQLALHGIQRNQGAIIGSRALSSFIRELFPGVNENRDVRQDRPAADLATSRGDSSHKGARRERELSDLVAAAAELAQPHNPPAERVPRRRRLRSTTHEEQELGFDGAGLSGLSRPTVPPPEDRLLVDPTLTTPIKPGPDSPQAQPAMAAAAQTGIVQPARTEVVAVASSNEPSEKHPQSSAPPLQPAQRRRTQDKPRSSRQASPASPTKMLAKQAIEGADARYEPPAKIDELPSTRDGVLPPLDRAESAVQATKAPAAVLVSPRDEQDLITEKSRVQPSSDEPASERSVPSESTKPLGERKRCIAVAGLLEGPAELFDEAEKLVCDIAYKLDGLVHCRGDRLVVLFGLPLADENDVVSAVRFSLDAQEALEHLDHSISADCDTITLRVGIRSSTARIVPGPGGPAYNLLGNSLAETINLAGHARAGNILIAGSAARRAAVHFLLREAPAIRRHGKPARCYRVQGPLDTKPRQGGNTDALVGREMELRALRGAWSEAVLASDQRSLLLLGDAGVGKSRLVDEFLLRHCADAQVLAASAMPHRRETPNALLLDLLRACTGVSGTSSARSRERMLDKLGAFLDHIDPPEQQQTLETLDSLLAPAEHRLGESEGSRRLEVCRALRVLLWGVAREHPLVVVLEDFHWADQSSVETIASLVAHTEDPQQALLVLMTARWAEDDTALEDLLSSAGAIRVTLDELDEGDRQRMILESLGGDASDELLHEVERRAGGNPFYISELGQVARELGPQALRDIPGSISGVVQSRIDRLPPQAKVVLQHAAVCGPTFREGILTRLLARNPARSLAELRNRGILIPGVNIATTGTAGVSEQFEREWAFRHVVVQEAIYESLSPTDRRELHAKLAAIMSTRQARGLGDSPAEIARHYEAAGQRAEACSCYLKAGQDALGQYANKEAERLFSRALEISGGSPPEMLYAIRSGSERVHGRLGMHDKQAEDIEVLKQLLGPESLPARRRSRREVPLTHEYRAAVPKAPSAETAAPNPRSEGTDDKLDARRRADLAARESLHLLRLGHFYRALESAERAEAAAIVAEDQLLHGEALRLRGEAYQRLDDHKRATEVVTKALEVFESEQSPAHQVRARIALGRILLAQSRYDDAMDHYGPALALIRQQNNRWQERVLRNNMAVAHLCRGDFSQALEDALHSLKLCIEFGDLAREGDNATLIGIVYLELGMLDLARRYLDDALTIHRDTNSRWSEADTSVHRGLMFCALGDHGAAFAELAHAKAIAQELGARHVEVSARNALALALCERHQPADASVALAEATEAARLARDIGLTVGEIPALSRAARAHALLGDLPSARALSRRAVELLDAQRHIDGPEQEIYYTHFRILLKMHDPRAHDFLELAHTAVQLKVAQLDDVEQRRCLTQAVRLNAAILTDYAQQAAAQ